MTMDHDAIRQVLRDLEMEAAAINDLYGALAARLPANRVESAGKTPPPDVRNPTGTRQHPRPPINAHKLPEATPTSDSLSPRRAPLTVSLQERTKVDDALLTEIAARKGMTATAAAAYQQVRLSRAWTRLKRLVAEGRLTVGADRVYRRPVAADGQVN